MDWKEIIFSDEFKAYRKEQTEVIARTVNAELKTATSDRLNGLLDMASKIIRLPSTLIKDEKLELELNKLVTEDLTEITTKLVRERINP